MLEVDIILNGNVESGLMFYRLYSFCNPTPPPQIAVVTFDFLTYVVIFASGLTDGCLFLIYHLWSALLSLANFKIMFSVMLSFLLQIGFLSRAGVKVSHCPAAAMRMLGFAPIREMLDSGICVSLGTDGAPSNNRMSIGLIYDFIVSILTFLWCSVFFCYCGDFNASLAIFSFWFPFYWTLDRPLKRKKQGIPPHRTCLHV